jgi:cysteine desulfurase
MAPYAVIYLDNNATTRPAPQVVEAMLATLRDDWANPSSIHRAGQRVHQKMELAREAVCMLIGCNERDLVLTSGGTEAANLAVLGSLRAHPDRKILVTTRIEHGAVRTLAQRLTGDGIEVIWLPNDEDGIVDLDALRDVLAKRGNDIALVSVMWTNNETGVIQPVEAIGAMCRERGVRFHTDATQWVGKMPCNVKALPIDLMNFASHKFHGPKGAGGLYIRPRVKVIPQAIGGSQERQRRGGTENTPGIVGMGVAAGLASQWLATDGRQRGSQLRDRLEHALLEAIPGAQVNSGSAKYGRGWNTSNIAFPGVEAEAILLLLSEKGVCASGGSACASGSLEPSPILQAMHLPPERTLGSIRFSLSRETTSGEIEQATDIIITVVQRLQHSKAEIQACREAAAARG